MSTKNDGDDRGSSTSGTYAKEGKTPGIRMIRLDEESKKSCKNRCCTKQAKNRRSGKAIRTILGFDKKMEHLMEEKGLIIPEGILYHYTGIDELESILRDGLRLSRLDEMMMAPDEGKEAIERATECISGSGCLSQEEKAYIISTLPSPHSVKMKRKLCMLPEEVKCTPYAICLTTLDFNQNNSALQEMISGRDIRLSLRANQIVSDLPGTEFTDCYGLIQFERIDYQYRTLDWNFKEWICCYIRMYRKKEITLEECANRIATYVDIRRSFRLSEEFKSEWETRLVIYVPDGWEDIPELRDIIGKKSHEGSDGSPILVDSDDDRYIYARFMIPKDYIEVDINPECSEEQRVREIVAGSDLNVSVCKMKP